VADAGREAKALRERAREQSEGLVTAARAELGQLQEAASRLRSEYHAATSTARALAARLLDAAGGPDDDHPAGDGAAGAAGPDGPGEGDHGPAPVSHPQG
jgi:hypothetical protein